MLDGFVNPAMRDCVALHPRLVKFSLRETAKPIYKGEHEIVHVITGLMVRTVIYRLRKKLSGEIFFESGQISSCLSLAKGHKAYEPGTRGGPIEAHKPVL